MNQFFPQRLMIGFAMAVPSDSRHTVHPQTLAEDAPRIIIGLSHHDSLFAYYGVRSHVCLDDHSQEQEASWWRILLFLVKDIRAGARILIVPLRKSAGPHAPRFSPHSPIQ
jgi:hypothetical protein